MTDRTIYHCVRYDTEERLRLSVDRGPGSVGVKVESERPEFSLEFELIPECAKDVAEALLWIVARCEHKRVGGDNEHIEALEKAARLVELAVVDDDE